MVVIAASVAISLGPAVASTVVGLVGAVDSSIAVVILAEETIGAPDEAVVGAGVSEAEVAPSVAGVVDCGEAFCSVEIEVGLSVGVISFAAAVVVESAAEVTPTVEEGFVSCKT